MSDTKSPPANSDQRRRLLKEAAESIYKKEQEIAEIREDINGIKARNVKGIGIKMAVFNRAYAMWKQAFKSNEENVTEKMQAEWDDFAETLEALGVDDQLSLQLGSSPGQSRAKPDNVVKMAGE